MADLRTFDRIRWKDRSSRNGEDEPDPLPWIGFDTETCRGNVRLLMDSDRRALWDPELGASLQFLYQPQRRGAFFNLRYDIECILKRLPREEMERLLSEGEACAAGFVMRWIPKKRFSLKPGDKWTSRTYRAAHHFDMAQFFNSGLDAAAKKYLGDAKQGLTKEQVRELGQTRAAWDKYPAARIEEYCYHDALLTRQLAELWDGWARDLDVDFGNPISPAYVSGEYAMRQGWPLYSRALHETVGKAAWLAFAGGRFESRVKGWGTYYSADIRSAYPAEMTQLPNPAVPWALMRKEKAALLSDWGFVVARVKVAPDLDWGPLPVQQKNGPLVYPVGNLGERHMTLDEYRALRENPDIKLDFRRAYVARDDGTRPLAWISQLYEKRRQLKQTCERCAEVNAQAVSEETPCASCGHKRAIPREYVLKVMMNAIYGKTMQKTPKSWKWRPALATDDLLKLSLRDLVRYTADGIPEIKEARLYDMGQLFNPIWGAHITARVRLKLWDACQTYDIASTATDGLLSREPFPSSFFRAAGAGDLGTWEDGGSRAGVIVGNGLYQMEGKKPKRRGFGEPLAGFEWITALQAAKPGSTAIKIETERPLHPGEVMRSRKYALDDVGLFVPVPKTIHLNADEKRVFPRVTASSLLSRQVIGKPLCL